MTRQYLSARLKAGETVYAAWVGSPSLAMAEAVAQASWDAVVVDMQHGAVGVESMIDLVGGVVRAGKPAMVRMPMSDEGMIGRILDAGAEAVICPMVNTGQDASRLGRSAKYPPLGFRSWGPQRALQVHGLDREDYLAQANGFCLAWAMVETETAIANIDSILSGRAIDGVFVGPYDLCVSLTRGEALDPSHPVVMEALDLIVRKARAHRVVPGIYASTPDHARTYSTMGFKLIAIGNELTYVRIGGELLLEAAREADVPADEAVAAQR